jgi:hypothetical protein
MSFEEKTRYKERKVLQYSKEGLIRELYKVADNLTVATDNEEISNLLTALVLDISVVADAIEQMENSKKYFAKKEAQQ